MKKLSTPQLIEKLKGHRVVSIASYTKDTAALVEPAHYSGAVWGAFGTNTVPVTTPFVKHMEDMVDDDEFSDECVHANRSILASRRCEHFAAIFGSGMRESVEGEISIPGVSKAVFLLLMEYIYTDSVMIEIQFAVDLYILADMYGLGRLGTICVTVVVKRNLKTENATTILQHAAGEGCHFIDRKSVV